VISLERDAMANTDRPGGACATGCGCSQKVAESAATPTRASATMTWRDSLGTLRVRFGIRRMDYRVRPGLYALGQPDATSPVLVSSNYKLSFDHLRRALPGRDAWILVLDTHGINVWCAAGKGLFGSDEVVRQVERANLGTVVTHRKLVLPQLAATGVAAHDVRRRTGFRVIYGPVRAADIPAFLDARMTATPAMRRVRYGLRDRAVLVPVEVVTGAKYLAAAIGVLMLVGLVATRGLSLANVAGAAAPAAVVAASAFLAGTVLGPLLLPWLPGRAFALKGAVLGLVVACGLAALGWPSAAFHGSWLRVAACALLVPALTSFVLMNFTGSSTFTSLSGVLREMRVAVPLQIASAAAGLILWTAGFWKVV
jgi:acetyl-CoA decarbonylase/synthase complex subunit gamma